MAFDADCDPCIRGWRALPDSILIEHLRFATALAARIHRIMSEALNIEDLFGAGALGLFRALDKYDPGTCAAFRTYARFRITSAMLESVGHFDWALREMLLDRVHRNRKKKCAHKFVCITEGVSINHKNRLGSLGLF